MQYKVIVAILTYNLEKYIEVALESVLSQKTDFSYKILIADDASTDSTPQILKKYQNMYPDKIELILAKKNVGCAGNALRLYERLDSEYFAILDGDDVWVSDYKLQHQVDFLEANREYTMCSGQTKFLCDDKIGADMLTQDFMNITYRFEDYFLHPRLFHVSGLLFRNVIFKYGVPRCFYETLNTFEECALRGEDLRRIFHLEKGPLYVLPEVVSLYRITISYS